MDTSDKDKENQGYKRVYFFKYFLTEEDWNARHDYHVQKRRLHLANLHGMGIQHGAERMLVFADKDPCMRVTVTPGFGVDEEGRMIDIREEDSVEIDISKFQLPALIYIKAVYQEMASDRVRLKNDEIHNKYFRETYRLIVSDKPANGRQLELARIDMTPDCTKVTDPADPYQPGPNEIDMRFRKSVPLNHPISPLIRHQLKRLLKERRNAFTRLGGNPKLPELALFAQDFAILDEILNSESLREGAYPGIMRFFEAFDDMLLRSISETYPPEQLDRPEWRHHVDNCRAFKLLLNEPGRTMLQKSAMAFVQMEKLSISYAHVVRFLGNDHRVYLQGEVKPIAKSYPITADWDFIKTWSAEMPPVFNIDNYEWLLMGELNITDEASEKRYKFRISDARDIWKERQRLYFPDGTLIEDTGVAHEGGCSEFEISGVIPDTHLCIVRMMNYVRGDYALQIDVNGQCAGISECVGFDRRARWRNWPFVIPAYYVNDTVLRIRQTCLTADRDINMYRFWFYQPTNW